MKHTKLLLWTAALLLLAAPALAQPQSDGRTVYSRAGEISPDTQAPTREALMAAIQVGTPSNLFAMLEYGERVECHECVPLLERLLLTSGDARVREASAWWLGRRPFGFAAVFHHMRTVLATDPDAVQRARAAEALGEFMDPHGVQYLSAALTADTDAGVRLAAVRGLGRINSAPGNTAIAGALSDTDSTVRHAALSQVLLVNFFRDYDSVMGRLADSDAAVRRQAALVIGTLRVTDAVPALAGLLAGDSDALVRQAAAWALGRVGGADAHSALTTQEPLETQRQVHDAIEIALLMH